MTTGPTWPWPPTPKARQRVVRTVYEACVFQALRDRLRCKEIWVVGAHEWRNPDEDLPADFEGRRAEHYQMLHQPLDAGVFVAGLRDELRDELAALDEALPRLGWLEIADHKSGAIHLTPLGPQPEPANLRRLKRAVQARWGTVPLIDVVKEAALRTGMLAKLTPIGTREAIDRETLWERLLLVAYAYGTNTGIRAIAGAEHGHSEEDLRYTARRYFSLEGAVASPWSWPMPPSPPVRARSGGRRHHHRGLGLNPLPFLRPEPFH